MGAECAGNLELGTITWTAERTMPSHKLQQTTGKCNLPMHTLSFWQELRLKLSDYQTQSYCKPDPSSSVQLLRSGGR